MFLTTTKMTTCNSIRLECIYMCVDVRYFYEKLSSHAYSACFPEVILLGTAGIDCVTCSERAVA